MKTAEDLIHFISMIAVAISICAILFIWTALNLLMPYTVYEFQESECKFKESLGTWDKSTTTYECIILGNGFLDWEDKEGLPLKYQIKNNND